MIKKAVIGLVGLGVLGGGAWAGINHFGGAQASAGGSEATAEEEEKPEYFEVRRGAIRVSDSGLPLLRNGLWDVTTVTDGVTMTAKICLDDAFQREASLFSLQLNASICAEAPTISRSGDSFSSEKTCAMGPVQLKETSRFTGDMHNGYVRQTDTVTTAPGIANQIGSQRETGTYAGACPADMSGGDMDMSGGRMNARTLLAIGGAAALPTGALDELDLSKMTPPRPARD